MLFPAVPPAPLIAILGPRFPLRLATLALLACAGSVAAQSPSPVPLPLAPLPAASLQQEMKPDRSAPVPSPSPSPGSEVAEVPGLSSFLHGVNAGVTLSGLHDSGAGWATLAEPALSISFNNHFSFDVTVPFYLYRLAATNVARPRPNQLLVPQRAELGDTSMAFHVQLPAGPFDYQATFTVTAPTGDVDYGLSTGRATFDLNNRFEHAFRRITPSVELGVGDSSTLINPLVTRNYTSLGPLAHFQLGTAFPLFWGLSFETSAYEQLPIGDQKIYRSVTRRGTTRTVVAGRSVTEDNGFTSSLDIPVDGHTTLSAYYNRSLRFKDDTVSMGITYVLRGFKSERELARQAATAEQDKRMLQSIQSQLNPVPVENAPKSPKP